MDVKEKNGKQARRLRWKAGAGRKRKKLRAPLQWKRIWWWALLLLSMVVVLGGFMLGTVVPKRYDFKAGDVATQSISAPRDVEDTVTTQLWRQNARDGVAEVYKRDESVATRVITNIGSFFLRCRMAAEEVTLWKKNNGETGPVNLSSLDAETSDSIAKTLYDNLWQDEPDLLQLVLNSTPERIGQLSTKVQAQAQAELDNGVTQSQVSDACRGIFTELSMLGFELLEARLGYVAAQQYLTANRMPDPESTELARKKAEESVQPAMFRMGQRIVTEGEVMSQAQIEVLRTLGLLSENGKGDWRLDTGLLLLVVMVVGMIALYIAYFEKDMLSSPSQCVLLCVIITLAMALSFLLMRVSTPLALSGVLIGALLVACLLHSRMAIIVGGMLSILSGLMATGADSLFNADMMVYVAAGLLSSMMGVYVLNKQVQRHKVFESGIGMGVVGSLIYVAAGLMTAGVWQDILIDALTALGAGLISAAFALGTLTVWEAVFDVVTPMKLMDIANPDRPLLKRLVSEAPGTYSHSIAVANLAERACEVIGANALLVRVGAYYHDVGKLRRPIFFVENLLGRENPHDRLTPDISRQVILMHVTDGVALAQKNRLPKVIQDIIQQHHGTTLISYFYYKAKKQAEAKGETVDENLYRYPGPRPQTKEAAILMLADSVEAAVKAMNNPAREQVEERVRAVIRAKMEDNQLVDCHLTLRELEQITVAFMGTLRGFYHERIAYPAGSLPAEEERLEEGEAAST
nr:HDIG domain-containing protein [bacterium]